MEPGQKQFSIWYFLIAFMLLLPMQDLLFGREGETLGYRSRW